jgi:peroxiredoxin
MPEMSYRDRSRCLAAGCTLAASLALMAGAVGSGGAEESAGSASTDVVSTGKIVTVTADGAGATPVYGDVQPGMSAPDFELTDLDGTARTLSDYAGKGKIVVLHWYNPTCRYIVNYAETHDEMRPVYERFGSDVVWLAINSGGVASGTADRTLNKEHGSAQGIEYPILADIDGAIGRLYGAKVTPQFFVLDSAGVVRYVGPLDDAFSDSKVGQRPLLSNAIQAVQVGQRVRPDSPRLFGCAVKYASQ